MLWSKFRADQRWLWILTDNAGKYQIRNRAKVFKLQISLEMYKTNKSEKEGEAGSGGRLANKSELVAHCVLDIHAPFPAPSRNGKK